MAPRRPNDFGDNWDDEDFSDIWDTRTRGQQQQRPLGKPRKRGEVDPERVWGTKEFNRKYGIGKDEWNTGLEDIPRITHRIKRDQEKIRIRAEKLKRKLELDAERIRADARRAAEKVRNKISDDISKAQLQGRREALKGYDFTAPSRIKKTKRRFKLSSKSGGIGIVGICFWGFLLFNMCSDNDSDTSKVADTNTTDRVVEQVKEGYDSLKPEVTALIDKAKEEFGKVTVSDGKTSTTYHKEKPSSNSSDPYSQPDDRYGSVDDKW